MCVCHGVCVCVKKGKGVTTFTIARLVKRLTLLSLATSEGSTLICCFRFGLHLFSLCSVYGVAILMPVNYYAGACESSAAGNISSCADYSGLDLISLTNVPEQSESLWAHYLSVYLFAGLALYLIEDLYLLVRL